MLLGCMFATKALFTAMLLIITVLAMSLVVAVLAISFVVAIFAMMLVMILSSRAPASPFGRYSGGRSPLTPFGRNRGGRSPLTPVGRGTRWLSTGGGGGIHCG